jgi:hypothetical protein
MTYIEDLSEYTYARSTFYRPVTKAVGWLSRDHKLETCGPTDELLDLIWQYCKFPVAQMRGIHLCEFCPSSFSATHDLSSLLEGLRRADSLQRAERNGEKLLSLGSAEIRAFGEGGIIYAAPTLIYHYVSVHHYNRPHEFLKALNSGPRPPSRDYFSRLEELDLRCNRLPSAE